MQSKVEDLSALERRFDISIPKEKVEEEVGIRLKRLAKTVKIHGFRPGKVPLKIMAQQYGPQVEQDVLSNMLQESFNGMVKEKGFHIAGYPRFEDKADGDDHHYEFSAIFEIYPEIILGDISQESVEQPVVEVNADDVDKTLEILRKQRTQYKSVDRAVVPGDQVNINYRGLVDGAEFEGGKAEAITLIIGDGKFLKHFEESIVGMNKGQNKSFEVVFPEDYHGKEIAGKVVTFEVILNSVEEPKLPELDAEFAKSLGLVDGDTKKMREEIQANLEMEVSKRIKSKLKDQVMQSLLDTTRIEAPRALVGQEIKRLIQEARQSFEHRGMKFDDTKISPDLFLNKADYRVKLGLILAEVVKTHNLKAQPEQVRKIIENSAQSYDNPEEVIKWHYSSAEHLKEAESVVLEDNVVTWVLQQVKVVNKATTFDQLMGIS
ncbi:MAG: trigger factor [Nitrosomonas sp.]|nr:trigger factor [Nitrosomonas sp.]MDP1950449.1 trigger factor [Nitrosomonas sp.]